MAKVTGTGICTLGLICNTTGDTLTLVKDQGNNLPLGKNWKGKIGPVNYPETIAQDQWGCFLHGDTDEKFGSSAAVVYRCKNLDGYEVDIMLAWLNPLKLPQTNAADSNKVYTEVQPKDQFQNANWPQIHHHLLNDNNNPATSENTKCRSTMTIAGDSICATIELV